MKRTVLFLSLLALLLLSASPAAGFELPQPDHGVEDEFDKLWSGYNYDPPSRDASVNEYLTKASDYVYSEPPGAPDRWNEGEVGEFFGGTEQISQHPPNTDLHDGESIKDAYVRIFGVSRSTRVLFSPDEEVVYVPSDGEVRGFTDYRIEGDNVVNHSFEVELVGVASDETVSDNGGFSISYDGLSSGRGARGDRGESGGVPATVSSDTVNLTLRGEFTATRRVGEETETERVVVEDTLEVKPDDPAAPPPIAIQGRYPDNDSALFFLREEPWSSVGLPDGTTVHSNWRFFSARANGWGPTKLSTARGTSVTDKVYPPLRVYAYPSRSGIHVDGDEADVQSVFGSKQEAPSLPEKMSFDLPRTKYKTAKGFDVRYSGDVERGDVEMNGIVHGTSIERPSFPAVQRIRETNLTLSVAGRNEDTDTVDVEVSLTDGEGRPIDTRGKDGFVSVEGHEDVETGIDGTTVVEVSLPPSGVVVAEYVPGRWYEAETPYVGDTATLDAGERFRLLEEIGVLSQLGVFLLPFLLLVYFTDRMLGLGIWPPWRRI